MWLKHFAPPTAHINGFEVRSPADLSQENVRDGVSILVAVNSTLSFISPAQRNRGCVYVYAFAQSKHRPRQRVKCVGRRRRRRLNSSGSSPARSHIQTKLRGRRRCAAHDKSIRDSSEVTGSHPGPDARLGSARLGSVTRLASIRGRCESGEGVRR